MPTDTDRYHSATGVASYNTECPDALRLHNTIQKEPSMSSFSQGSYLETEVMTAPPQKLQLMLIEGAIRCGRQTQTHWKAGQDDQACETLIRAQQIVTELISGLNREAHPELVKKVASVYLFIYRGLVEAGLEHDEEKLDDAIRVLEEERETWRSVCKKGVAAGATANSRATPVAEFPPGSGSADTGGISLEA